MLEDGKPLCVAREKRHIDVATHLKGKMAEILYSQGKYSEALQVFTEVFNTQKVKLGPDHPDALITYHNMAAVLYKQGNYSETLRILQEILNIEKVKLGPGHPSTVLTSCNIEIVSKQQAETRLSEETDDNHETHLKDLTLER
ncbi:tetratricopeptide repeat protein [Wolbachia endosymbiont of Ctenocephalides felis wCfeJ]|uniref:tetratricopeptide repeat protein n=1 Tax=Wolbachia endosymbiont of Ctenocephalides felis wCfeJ TaxID=2732594 RepID=UPI001448499F|nr:tetratricopeptide repeat protein [Wolbachia endosymbiont of Ctenocephalides felis wCfeJ]WCR58331.1 MAG: hypothetical protein PG980_000803 [Wolbachia endosymbiont of Ctenocephalides felis wCfeJ]